MPTPAKKTEQFSLADLFQVTINEGVDRKLFTPESIGRNEKQQTPAAESPYVITESRTKPFYCYNDFWKDGNPVTYDEMVHARLHLDPSPRQMEIAKRIVGDDPYEWDTRKQRYIFGIGQGGGKNRYIIAPSITYLSYKIGNMKDPHYYFSHFCKKPISRNTLFEFSNSSMVSGEQAVNVHFQNLQNYIRNLLTPEGENWFQKYCKMDIREEGKGDIKRKTIVIETLPFAGKIKLHSCDSKKSSVEGLELLIAVVDEPSRAETAATFAEVLGLWDVICGNVNTRFPNKVGKTIAFSYLNQSEYDFTYKKLTEAEDEKQLPEEDQITYAVNYSTFEVNPTVTKNDVGVRADYRTDPNRAAARYEGIKGSSKEAFYNPHVDTIAPCFIEMQSPVQYETVYEPLDKNDKTGKKYVAIKPISIKGDLKQRCVAFDASENGDSFIMKMGYTEVMDEVKENLWVDEEHEMVTINQRPIVDVVLTWQPTPETPVNYLNVGTILGILIDHFPNIVSVKSDKYQSVKLIQEVKARGIDYKNIKDSKQLGVGNGTDTLSFSAKMQLKLYTKLRWMVWNNIPRFHKDQMHHVVTRGVKRSVGEHNLAEHVHLLKENNKIVHAPDKSKDFADVDAILINDLVNMEVKQRTTGDIATDVDTEKFNRMAVKYMELRQQKRNEGANEHTPNTVQWISAELGLTTRQGYRLKKYVEEMFPGT